MSILGNTPDQSIYDAGYTAGLKEIFEIFFNEIVGEKFRAGMIKNGGYGHVYQAIEAAVDTITTKCKKQFGDEQYVYLIKDHLEEMMDFHNKIEFEKITTKTDKEITNRLMKNAALHWLEPAYTPGDIGLKKYR